MEPLSVRLYEFIRSNPGLDGTHIISSVLDLRTEKVSDAERILQVLNNTGKVYACEIFDSEMQRFVSFYYPMDAIPSYAGIPGRKEVCRCPFRRSWRTVYHPFAIPLHRKRREVR